MTLIKLGAIDSTNDFLKHLVSQDQVANFTVVVAENQTKGKGQMGSSWVSESGKNLTMSIFVKDILPEVSQIFTLNVAVALAIIKVLQDYEIPNLSIKWPNDILSANKKIAGVLIENSIKSDGEITSVIGIGINVNQQSFEGLPNASSLQLVAGRVFDLDLLVTDLTRSIAYHATGLLSQSYSFWQNYHSYLFKIGEPVAFEDANGLRFMGIIQGVNTDGTLRLILENDATRNFGIKEVKMLY